MIARQFLMRLLRPIAIHDTKDQPYICKRCAKHWRKSMV